MQTSEVKLLLERVVQLTCKDMGVEDSIYGIRYNGRGLVQAYMRIEKFRGQDAKRVWDIINNLLKKARDYASRILVRYYNGEQEKVKVWCSTSHNGYVVLKASYEGKIEGNKRECRSRKSVRLSENQINELLMETLYMIRKGIVGLHLDGIDRNMQGKLVLYGEIGENEDLNTAKDKVARLKEMIDFVEKYHIETMTNTLFDCSVNKVIKIRGDIENEKFKVYIEYVGERDIATNIEKVLIREESIVTVEKIEGRGQNSKVIMQLEDGCKLMWITRDSTIEFNKISIVGCGNKTKIKYTMTGEVEEECIVIKNIRVS